MVEIRRGEGTGQFPLAPRLDQIQGKTVGLLDNIKPNTELFLKEIGRLFQERYGAADVLYRFKEAVSRPAPVEVIEDLAQHCDFVVTAIGD